MQLIAPVTDYIPASILTTLNDKVIRGAAIPERIAEIDWRGIHIGNNTRNATGDQVIAGVGFVSKVIVFLGVDVVAGNRNWTVGFGNLVNNRAIFWDQAGALCTEWADRCMVISRGGGNILYGLITVIGADGFTITWTGGGVFAACNFQYLCFS